MKNNKSSIAIIGSTVLALTACGGGGGGESASNSVRATCSNFAYQEDAQAALLAGQTQLDRDNDGIACESLPHRPSGGSGGTGSGSGGGSSNGGQPTVDVPSIQAGYNSLSTFGKVYVFRPGVNEFYNLSLYGPFDSVTGISLQLGDTADYLRAASSWATLFLHKPLGETTTTTSLDAGPADGGIGYRADSIGAAQIVGHYTLLGQSCLLGSQACKPLVATAIATATTLSLCLKGITSTASCESQVTLPITQFDSTKSDGLFNIGESRAFMMATSHGEIAFSYQDQYESYLNQNPLFTRYTFFGVRQDAILTSALPAATSYDGYSSGPNFVISQASTWQTVQNVPLLGMRQDPQHRTTLLSAGGQLVTWSSEEGLRVYKSR